MSKIKIYEVAYTNTDETFYIMNKIYEDAEKYAGNTLEEIYINLENDGWKRCGKINQLNNVYADMFSREGVYIAVCEEK